MLLRGEPPPRGGLRAQVPVNIRPDEKAHALGNELTSLFVELPVDEPDPPTRYDRVVAQARGAQEGLPARGRQDDRELADMGPPLAGAVLARLMFGGTRMFNLTITNVPGPQFPLYAFGARLARSTRSCRSSPAIRWGSPSSPTTAGWSSGSTPTGRGLPDLGVLVEGIEHSLAELRPEPAATQSHIR